MKSSTQILLLIGGLWVFAQANAHDPSLHTEKSEKPDCAAFEKMDHSEMDPKDPVMQAMMKKCRNAMQDHPPEEEKADQADHEKHDRQPGAPNADGHAH